MSRSAGRVHKRSQTRLNAANGLPKWLRVLRNSLWTILHNIYHFSQIPQKQLIKRYYRTFFIHSPSCAPTGATRMRMIATHLTQRLVARFWAVFAAHCTAFLLPELGNKRTTSVVPSSALLGLLRKARHLRRIFPCGGWFGLTPNGTAPPAVHIMLRPSLPPQITLRFCRKHWAAGSKHHATHRVQ